MRVMRKLAAPAVVAAVVALGLAGCGKSTPTAASTVTVTATTTVTETPSTSASTSASTTAATTSTSTAQNLVATPAVRATLLQVGAESRGLTASDFTGLAPGETYYAVDTTTGTDWAGARLVPSSSSMQAEVSAQDDGAYSLFEKLQGGSWQTFEVGLAQPGECPQTVPTSILQLWGWPAMGCHPNGV